MQSLTKRPQLVVNVPTLQDAEEQVAMVSDMIMELGDVETEEEKTKSRDLHAALSRACMIRDTKKIALSPEELAELRALSRKAASE